MYSHYSESLFIPCQHVSLLSLLFHFICFFWNFSMSRIVLYRKKKQKQKIKWFPWSHSDKHTESVSLDYDLLPYSPSPIVPVHSPWRIHHVNLYYFSISVNPVVLVLIWSSVIHTYIFISMVLYIYKVFPYLSGMDMEI